MTFLAEVPARPDGLELIGTPKGSGYRTPPALVRRQDGQALQLTPLLYAVLEAVDGRRGYAEIAKRVAARTGRPVTAANVKALADDRLRPMGLLVQPDGTTAAPKRSNPLLGLRFKFAVTDPAVTRRLTDPFRILFNPWIWVPLVAVFGAFSWWLLMEHGLAAATYQAFAKPSLLVIVLVVTVLSAAFHEFGHAAAARRGGAEPGVMGAGLYLLWPAFYTDVTDSYRLGRFGRIRTDLGGLYFNAIVAVMIAAAWWISGWDALLLVVATQLLQMVRQLTPLVRFDGYHVLADLIGVPDLFSRIGPILASFWPTRRSDPRVTQLKGWARLLVTCWVLVVVPILLFTLGAIVLAFPRLVGTAAQSMVREQRQMTELWNGGQGLDAIGAAVAMVAVGVPILAVALLLFRVARRAARTMWRKTEGQPVRRAGATVASMAVMIAVLLVWWPSPQRYAPIQPYETGTVFDLGAGPQPAAAISISKTGRPVGGQINTVLPATAPLPTESQPRLALVLVPSPAPSTGGDANDAAPSWVFPFDRPLPPGSGDNQALAVNTTDGSVAYKVAIAMVWVTGDEPVLNTNEAYAFASCGDCVTVAIAFQVVAIVGDANVVVPQNLSAAVNYNCFACITAAVASQLVVTVDSAPTAEQQVALADVWQELQAFATTMPTMPLADVLTRLEAYKAEILTILGGDPLPLPSPSASPELEPTPSGLDATPSDGSVPSQAVSGSPSAAASSLPTAPGAPTEPAPTPTDAPAPTGAPSATLSQSPTPSELPGPSESAPTSDPSGSPDQSPAPSPS